MIHHPTLRRLIVERDRRERHFPGLADPAWTMLLDLTLSASSGRQESVTSLCLAAYAPATTALRYISLLVGEGLAEREPDPQDARRVFVKLTDEGASRIAKFCADLPGPTG